VNTVIALQGFAHSVVQPDHYAYGLNLLLTIPLGVVAVWLILLKGIKAGCYKEA
jgi:hypothetical protein